MSDAQEMSEAAADFRRHFDEYYLAVVPRLLDEQAMFLSFVTMLTAVESLAGAYMPDHGTGERFREFIAAFFPKVYEPHAEQLWKFRNRMIHAFNPSPFAIVCHRSRMHLCEVGTTRMLNAEDFYADLVTASRGYFGALYADLELQSRFIKRITSDDGGRPIRQQLMETVDAKESAV
jgi:hypothetical protein